MEIVKDLRSINADYLNLEIAGSRMTYESRSDQGSVSDEIRIKGSIYGDSIVGTYSMEYLEALKILKSDMVWNVASHKPLKIQIGSEQTPYLEFWQAPRVES